MSWRSPSRRRVKMTPATIGAGLGRSLALATVVGMIMFGIAMALMIYFTEVHRGVPPRPACTSTTPRLSDHQGGRRGALAFAGPVGIGPLALYSDARSSCALHDAGVSTR